VDAVLVQFPGENDHLSCTVLSTWRIC
jgi:hypothetical protein